ncbi:MAG TPA: hypothetical protein VIG49_01870, partial [Acetobacteraceae bacterium]
PGAWKETGIPAGGLVTGAGAEVLLPPPPPPPHPAKDNSADRTASVPMTVDRILLPFEDDSRRLAPVATVLIIHQSDI